MVHKARRVCGIQAEEVGGGMYRPKKCDWKDDLNSLGERTSADIPLRQQGR